MLSIIEFTASLGGIVGPVMGGLLKELVGYACMTWVWSKLWSFTYLLTFLISLGSLYIVVGFLAVRYLGRKNEGRISLDED